MYYSLAQQLIRQDVGIYRLHVQMGDESDSHQLLAYPTPARFFGEKTIAKAMFHEGASIRIRNKLPTDLKDEFVFCGSALANESLQVMSNGGLPMRDWLREYPNSTDFVDLLQKQEEEPEYRTPMDMPSAEKENCEWKNCEANKSYGYTLTQEWTPWKFDFVATEDRMSVSTGFMHFLDHETLLNGVNADVVARWHRDFHHPDIPRYSGMEEDQLPYEFPSVQLTGLGALSDALVGRAGWNSSDVELEVSQALGPEGRLWCLNWRKTAIDCYLRAFERLKAHEKAKFGDKSYFYLREKKLQLDANDQSDEYWQPPQYSLVFDTPEEPHSQSPSQPHSQPRSEPQPEPQTEPQQALPLATETPPFVVRTPTLEPLSPATSPSQTLRADFDLDDPA